MSCPNFAINLDRPAWTWWVLGISIAVLVIGVTWVLHRLAVDDRREQERLDRDLAVTKEWAE